METVRRLKPSYQNGLDNIGRDLILPCLESCSLYRRGTGFFSSSSLKSYAATMDRVISDEVKLEVLCSPVVQDHSLLRTLQANISKEQREKTILKIAEDIVLTAIGFKLNPDNRDYRATLIAYLIASGQLEIKFAIPRNFDLPTDESLNTRSIYHVKLGYFNFPDGSQVAFDGSFNESDSGHSYHVDRTQVYRSWIDADIERLNGILRDINKDWNGENEFISVRKLSKETLELVKKCSPSTRPHQRPTEKLNIISHPQQTPSIDFPSDIWQHKKAAVLKFLEEKHGVLEMATGTGKTSTALEIVRQLFLSGEIETIVISTYLKDLLAQWCEEIQRWQIEQEVGDLDALRLFRQFGGFNELQRFLNNPKNSILVVSRDAEKLKRVLLSRNINPERTIVIHDEIHGFGAPSLVSNLRGLHKRVKYRLGLSATPEREYDEVGSNFIVEEVGPTIFNFPLEDAIKAGILCEFDYRPLRFQLTDEDRAEKKRVFARKANAVREGNPWSEERLYIELSKVVKKAELKPLILGEFLSQNPEVLKSSILFVLDQEHGDRICEVVRKFTYKYRTYYSGTEHQYLTYLADGTVDCLIACERLNEGIDIRALNSVILISSDRAKLKTIQRIGRCLRQDPGNPGKRALVVDFVLEDENQSEDETADESRMEWLSDISRTRRQHHEPG